MGEHGEGWGGGGAVAIIPSAGMGTRLGGRKKNLLKVADVPVIVHTLRAFEETDVVSEVILVVAEGDIDLFREVVLEYAVAKVKAVVAGGAERQDSVRKGMEAARSGFDVTVVHDGARPMVTSEIIERCVRSAVEHGGAVAAVPVKNTIKEVVGGRVERTVAREGLYAVQTPQAFRSGLLEDAHRRADEEGFLGTDESSLVERVIDKSGDKGDAEVVVVEGSYENIKVTTEEDLVVAELFLGRRRGKAPEKAQ